PISTHLPRLLLCLLPADSPALSPPSSFFFSTIPRPPTSTLFPTRRSSDLVGEVGPVGRLLGPGGLLCCGGRRLPRRGGRHVGAEDRKSTRLNSSHVSISYAVFCLKKKKSNGDRRKQRMERRGKEDAQTAGG